MRRTKQGTHSNMMKLFTTLLDEAKASPCILGCSPNKYTHAWPTFYNWMATGWVKVPPSSYFYYRDPQWKILPLVSGVFDMGLFVLGPTSSLTLGQHVTLPLLIFYYRDPQITILPQVSSVFDMGLFGLGPTSSLTLGQRVTPLLIFTIGTHK